MRVPRGRPSSTPRPASSRNTGTAEHRWQPWRRRRGDQGALYFHFPSKNALAVAVIDAQHALGAIDGERVLAQGRPPLETMILISRGFATQLAQHPVMRAGIRLSFEASAFGHEVRQPYLDWAAAFDGLSRQAQLDGLIAPEVDTAAFARLLVGAYTGVQLVSGILTGREDVLERLADLWRTVLPGALSPDRQEEVGRLVELFLEGPPDQTTRTVRFPARRGYSC